MPFWHGVEGVWRLGAWIVGGSEGACHFNGTGIEGVWGLILENACANVCFVVR